MSRANGLPEVALGGVAIALIVVAILTSSTPMSAAVPIETPTLTPTPTPTSTPTPTPSPTPTPNPTPSPTPTPRPPQDHYWLSRPIGPQDTDWAHRYYPYGTTGEGQYLVHHGVDMVNATGTQVLAVGDGEVVVVGEDSSEAYGLTPDFYGKLVVLRLDRPYFGQRLFCLYGHLSETLVQVGERVRPGDVVGEVGETGIALGPHLHFEIRLGDNDYGATRNPDLWLKPFEGHGTIAGRLLDDEGEPLLETKVEFIDVSQPQKIWKYTYTYSEDSVNSDQFWQENFTMGDIPAGSYVVRAKVDGRRLSKEVQIRSGRTSFVILSPE